jgi:hypothetical protein
MAKETLNIIAKAIKSNRILMIVCVFVVMGLAVMLIQFLQEKTLERFTSAYTIASTPAELSEGEHGEKHAAECVHLNNEGGHHTCGHAHTENTAGILNTAGLISETNNTYTVANTGSLSANE